MTGLALAGVLGISALTSVGLGFGLGWWFGRRPGGKVSVTNFEIDRGSLDDLDRRQIAADFGVHAASMRQQVSLYADQLANGDAVLRERLRHFEQGARQ